MFRNSIVITSVVDIKRTYPDQWVAIAIRKTDRDGLPIAGELLVHDRDQEFVSPALSLEEADDPVYVFYTGSRGPVAAAA